MPELKPTKSMKEKTMHDDDKTLWCVHVYGPDDVVAQQDIGSALQLSNEINAAMVKMERTANDAIITAVAEPYPYSGEQHAAELAKHKDVTWNKPQATALISAAIDEAVGELPTILSGLVAAVDEFKRRANPAMSGKELAAFAAICHFTTRARAALNQEKEKKPSGQ